MAVGRSIDGSAPSEVHRAHPWSHAAFEALLLNQSPLQHHQIPERKLSMNRALLAATLTLSAVASTASAQFVPLGSLPGFNTNDGTGVVGAAQTSPLPAQNFTFSVAPGSPNDVATGPMGVALEWIDVEFFVPGDFDIDLIFDPVGPATPISARFFHRVNPSANAGRGDMSNLDFTAQMGTVNGGVINMWTDAVGHPEGSTLSYPLVPLSTTPFDTAGNATNALATFGNLASTAGDWTVRVFDNYAGDGDSGFTLPPGGPLVDGYINADVVTIYAIVPEPASLSLLAIGSLAMLRRRCSRGSDNSCVNAVE
jgi:hypothetical protein